MSEAETPATSIDAIMASIRRSITEAPVADENAPGATPPVSTPSAATPSGAMATSAPPLAPATAGITLEALVRSMLAPMLKEWLDANLPEIVETATRAEIGRLTGLSK